MLLAVDPGAHTGWAQFFGRELLRCGLVKPAQWDLLVLEVDCVGSQAVIEEPTIYRHGKARPADVMALQLKVGELKGRFEAAGCRVELVQPRTWKRQVPKPIHHRRVLAALADAERELCAGARHDVLDAVGLGLWKLGRLR